MATQIVKMLKEKTSEPSASTLGEQRATVAQLLGICHNDLTIAATLQMSAVAVQAMGRSGAKGSKLAALAKEDGILGKTRQKIVENTGDLPPAIAAIFATAAPAAPAAQAAPAVDNVVKAEIKTEPSA